MIAASQIKGEPADDRFERQPPLEQRGATAHRPQSDGDKKHGDPNYLLSASSEEEEEEGGGCVGSGRSVQRPAGSFRTDQSTTMHASSRQKMGGVPDSKASIKPAAGKQKILYILYYSSIIWIRLLGQHIF